MSLDVQDRLRAQVSFDELRDLLHRVQYPEWLFWDRFDGMVEARDQGLLVGAFTYRCHQGTLRLGKFAADGPTTRARYRVARALMAYVDGAARARRLRVRASIDTRTRLYPIVVKLLRRHGLTETTPERADHTAWIRET